MMPTAYQVTLPVFEGPLDLLLHLIERQELDITEVSLAQVTNQYLEYLAQVSECDPDSLAGFLVVAAKLLLIKSRVLLPQPPAPPSPKDAEGDVGEDLMRQLVLYKKFKEAARWLKEIDEQGLRSYVRLAAPPSLEEMAYGSVEPSGCPQCRTIGTTPGSEAGEPGDEAPGRGRADVLGDVTLDDLLAAVRQALAVKPDAPSVNGTVSPFTLTIADQMELIEQETVRSRTVRFRRLLERATNRLEVIVTLLALLEMVKQRRVMMHQDQLFGDILIVRKQTNEQ